MKKFFALILALIMTLSMAACTVADSSSETSDTIVYTGEFKVAKLEVYDDAGDYRYIMAIKNDEVALLFRVNAATYLEYEVGDIVSGEVKRSSRNYYDVRLGADGEWRYTLETIGLED